MGDVGAASWRGLQGGDNCAGLGQGVGGDPEPGFADAEFVAAQRDDGSVCRGRSDGAGDGFGGAYEAGGEIFAGDGKAEFEAASQSNDGWGGWHVDSDATGVVCGVNHRFRVKSTGGLTPDQLGFHDLVLVNVPRAEVAHVCAPYPEHVLNAQGVPVVDDAVGRVVPGRVFKAALKKAISPLVRVFKLAFDFLGAWPVCLSVISGAEALRVVWIAWRWRSGCDGCFLGCGLRTEFEILEGEPRAENPEHCHAKQESPRVWLRCVRLLAAVGHDRVPVYCRISSIIWTMPPLIVNFTSLDPSR